MRIWPEICRQSDAWFRARAGRPTASQFHRIITSGGRDSGAWESYAIELIAQCLRPGEGAWPGNAHTERHEQLAARGRDAFATATGLAVETAGFVTRADEVAGCSPDGLVRERAAAGLPASRLIAGLELKCPLPKNHARYLVDGGLPARYRPQVHGCMAVTGLREWYFVSYCPGLAPHIHRVEWDAYTDLVADALDRFLIYYACRRKELLPRLLGKESA